MNVRPAMALLAGVLALAGPLQGRPGTITWSDGRQLHGDLTLTPGQPLKLFTGGGPVELPLEETRQIRFTPDEEKMAEGFYFPNAGQATQAKTGEVYPTRRLRAQVTLPDGRVLDGHLFTTVLYVQNDDGAQKVLLEAKQTGTNGEKMTDLRYVTAIDFSDAAAGESHLDLSHETIPGAKLPVVVAKPDLAAVSLQPGGLPQSWTLPAPDPQALVLAVTGSDGIHVAWPALDADPPIVTAVQAGLKTMQDFYDTRVLLGTQAAGSDVYSLVLMSRHGATDSFAPGRMPWSVVVLHWTYDADTGKVSLVHRAMLAMGRVENGGSPPAVVKNPALLNDITAPTPAAAP